MNVRVCAQGTGAKQVFNTWVKERMMYAHGDLTSLAPHERLPEVPVVPREKPHTGAAARENPRDAPVIVR